MLYPVEIAGDQNFGERQLAAICSSAAEQAIPGWKESFLVHRLSVPVIPGIARLVR